MDPTTTSALGIAGIASGVIAALYTYMKHSSCRGNCCGQKVDMTIDLTPPPSEKNLLPINESAKKPEVQV